MTVSTAAAAERRTGGFWSTLRSRELDTYPDTGVRYGLLALVVVITTALYYELYVTGSVATLQLTALHMSFSFYVVILAFGNLIGAFGSLFAGLADRLGRCNLVVVGLLFTGIMVAFVLPEATSRWAFGIESFVVFLVEGICLVATPALVRDFSPQVGRASAMSFWTMGPVLGSLVVAVVATNTINAHTAWPHEYRIAGVVGLVVFGLAGLFLRELSPGLRDQLMVSLRDRALVEARAKGIDIEAALRHPFRQLLKPDIVVSALGVSLLLVSYYTAVSFGTIFFTTVYGFKLQQANSIGDWNWSINIAALLIAGVLSDRLRVRKPFMVVGGVWAAIATVFFLSAIGHHQSYYHVVLLTALVSFGLGLSYVTWMASYTESVEARNPALTATGLAIWGWIIRVVVFGLFLILPLIVNTVNPLVNYGTKVQTLAAQYATPLAFAQQNPGVVAFAQTNAATLDFAAANPGLVAFAQANAATLGFASTHASVVAEATANAAELTVVGKFAPELAVIQKNPALFTQLAGYTNPASIPPALLAQGVAAAGGGATGAQVLQTIVANKAAILGAASFAQSHPGVIADVTRYAPQLKALEALEATNGAQLAQVQANAPQLAALSKLAATNPADLAKVQADKAQLAALAAIPKADLAYIQAHGTAVTRAAARTGNQWKHWYWVAFGGVVFFLLAIPLLKGRWSPRKAKADEDAHEAMVQAELAKLNA
jgi:MFS family permease